MHDSTQLGEELIKEIMDSSFISANTKKEYCNQLDSLTPTPVESEEVMVGTSETKLSSDFAEYRSRMVWMVSIMLGFMTTLMTMVLGFSDIFRDVFLFFPFVIALFTVLMTVTFTLLRQSTMPKVDEDYTKPNIISISKTDKDTI